MNTEEYDSITPGEKAVISADDANAVGTGGGGDHQHHDIFFNVVETVGNITNIAVEGVYTDGTGAEHYLKCYNWNTPGWDTIGTSGAQAPSMRRIAENIVADFDDYVQAEQMKMRLIAATGGDPVSCRFAESVVTYSEVGAGDPTVGRGIFVNAN